MNTLRRVGGALARLGYTLARYQIAAIPLDLIAISTLFLSIPWKAWMGWRQGFEPHGFLIMGACGVLTAALLFLRSQRYVIYQYTPKEESPGQESTLSPDQKVDVRASGYFEVGENRRYFVQIPAQFVVTELGEYIVMARLRHRSSLGPIKRIPDEWGWWYAFIAPKTLQRLDSGRLYFGLSAYRTIRIIYERYAGKHSVLYLSFNDRETHSLIAGALRQSIPT